MIFRLYCFHLIDMANSSDLFKNTIYGKGNEKGNEKVSDFIKMWHSVNSLKLQTHKELWKRSLDRQSHTSEPSPRNPSSNRLRKTVFIMIKKLKRIWNLFEIIFVMFTFKFRLFLFAVQFIENKVFLLLSEFKVLKASPGFFISTSNVRAERNREKDTEIHIATEPDVHEREKQQNINTTYHFVFDLWL